MATGPFDPTLKTLVEIGPADWVALAGAPPGVMAMMESSTYRATIREGEVRGSLIEARKFLIMQGEHRFGALDRRTRKALDGIVDLPRLEALGIRLLEVNSWQELLAEEPTPAAPVRRRPRRSEDT